MQFAACRPCRHPRKLRYAAACISWCATRNMALSDMPFEQVQASDIARLIRDGVREGRLIEFKSAIYGSSDDQKREMLKDISSFANTSGGRLILGMQADEGIAAQIAPLAGVEIDKELQRMGSITQSSIEPRIPGLRFHPVDVPGGTVIVVHIPKSWSGPHRVTFRGVNRFYARNSTGAYEPEVEELREMFTQASTALERAREFHRERLARIDAGRGPIVLAGNPDRIVIHLAPLGAFVGADNRVDLALAYESRNLITPIEATEFTTRYNADGIMAYSAKSTHRTDSYVQLFRSGTIEACRTGLIKYADAGATRKLLLSRVELWLARSMERFLQMHRAVGNSAPFLLSVTLQNVDGAVPDLGRYEEPGPAIINRSLELPDAVVDGHDLEAALWRGIRTCCDVLWNAADKPCSPNFSNGLWQPGVVEI